MVMGLEDSPPDLLGCLILVGGYSEYEIKERERQIGTRPSADGEQASTGLGMTQEREAD